jgi:hypothetical protein
MRFQVFFDAQDAIKTQVPKEFKRDTQRDREREKLRTVEMSSVRYAECSHSSRHVCCTEEEETTKSPRLL